MRTRSASPSMPSPVAAVFSAYPAGIKAKLLALRRLILGVAAKMDVEVEETLRWRQAAYVSKGGSTIRIDRLKGDASRVAMFFICHTDLIATFRELYPELSYEGNRAILLNMRGRLPEDALRHCVSLALTYRSQKK
jgi:hypothetical protein